MCKNIKTDELENQLSDIENFSDYIEKNGEELISDSKIADYLNSLITETGCKKSDIIKRTNLNRAYVYQIFEGRKIPSRDKLISIALGMELDFDQMQKLLKYAGLRPLYARDLRDAAIIYSLKNGGGFNQTNCVLFEQGLRPLE
ncbi:MAG: hypothetical protein IJF18_02175 [Oscillospiraceae bacterium]|nr:hypothetical protein [Oscillospiraceae bacterium]